MAYNNGFPLSYQPNYYQQYQPAQQNNSAIIWVQGEAGAKSYLVAPNTTVQLWDSESQTIYLKSADASGMPSIKILDYTIRNAETFQNKVFNEECKYASIEDLEPLKQQINALEEKIRKLQPLKKEKGGSKNESAVSANEWS